MRFPWPRTLLSLTLTALALITLPLLIGVGTAVLKLNDLAEQSALAVRASADSTRENERLTAALTNLRRDALQYNALAADPDLGPTTLARYRDRSVPSLIESLGALRALEHSSAVDEHFETIEGSLEAVGIMLTAEGVTRELLEENLDIMAAAAGSIRTIMREDIADRLVALEADSAATQRTLAWQAAALIPGMLMLVLFFLIIVGRPMRRIDRAIRELGEGDYSRPIAIRGPRDIETLGRQLEWLRQRLTETTEEKNKFLRHMSHELKTPLANIREGSELLLDGSVGLLDRQQQEVTSILRENSVRLQRLIENLLTFSAWQARTAQLEIVELELKPLVFATLSQHRLVISNRKIKLDTDVAAIRVRADEGKLRLVLENLISNAIKFTPENGRIRIRAQMEQELLVLEVADSGPGIAPEDQDRIFEAFYQGRRLQGGPVGGTGIGLSVVQECVQAHGGTIELKSESALGGAHFVVNLPLRRAVDRPQLTVAHG